jgi:histidyl-tRNA synthetase
MPKIPPRILKGFRDYLPEEMLPREKMFHCLREVFQSYGFLPLMTPALEYADILLGKYGDEGDSLLYRFLDNGERDVALRYDLTVPLARVVAQYPDLPLPFRRYQISPVWRAEKPATSSAVRTSSPMRRSSRWERRCSGASAWSDSRSG